MLRTTLGLAFLFLTGCAGCKVVVLGDSNCCFWPRGCYPSTVAWDWPARLQKHTVWTVINRSLAGLRARDRGWKLANGEPAYAGSRLDALLATDLADACGPLEPRPKLVLHLQRGKIIGPPILGRTPAWARSIVAAARKNALSQQTR